METKIEHTVAASVYADAIIGMTYVPVGFFLLSVVAHRDHAEGDLRLTLHDMVSSLALRQEHQHRSHID